jgi:SNF2 family DNA or RNA helicase
LIILSLNEENENMMDAKIKGKSFYEDLNILKNTSGALYDSEEKIWMLPRNMRTINYLKNKTTVLTEVDEYTLAGVPSPPLTTPVDVIKKKSVIPIDQLNDVYKLNTMKLDLFDFQKVGVICSLFTMQQNGGFLLADTMGLGKTIQALGVAHSLFKRGECKKVIVSCPKNVKYQWADEVETFTDLKPIVVDGYNRKKRLECFEEEGDIYITNHDQLINDDFDYMMDISPDLLIIDEIHYFKNHSTKRTRALKKIGELTKYRLGLTGTPMQNHPSDVHSVFEFLIPNLFGSFNSFKKKYIYYSWDYGYPQEEGYQNLFDLKKRISPYMIRRLTHDVRDDMPEVYQKTHYVEMSKTQKEIHEKVSIELEDTKDQINALRQSIAKAKGKRKKKLESELEELDGRAMGLMNIQMEVSNNLSLLKSSESGWVKQFVKDVPISPSAKFKHTMKLIKSVLEYDEDFKIVIFSQFARMVKELKEEILDKNYSKEVATIYGELNEKQRNDEKRNFIDNKECRVIVMSDAGAEGLNLQVASHLINYDYPWNPAIIDQRNGRINRIGSPWDKVFISNMISKESIDEKVEKAVNKKRKTSNQIVENTDRQKELLSSFIKEII